jgi:hypothetical protein
MRVGVLKRSFEPNPRWSRRSSAINGGLAGIAIAALHQVYHAISNNTPDIIYAYVIGEMVAGVAGGALLFTAISALRNRLKRRR